MIQTAKISYLQYSKIVSHPQIRSQASVVQQAVKHVEHVGLVTKPILNQSLQK